jgi:hypothetical protein
MNTERGTLRKQIKNLEHQATMDRWPVSKAIDA